MYEGKAYPELFGKRMHEKFLKIDLQKYAEKQEPKDGHMPLTIAGNFLGNFPYSIDVGQRLIWHNVPFESEWVVKNDNVTDYGILKKPGAKDGYLVFARFSEDYEKFLNEVLKFKEIQESTDMSTIYLRDNIFTNISGGVGIFGAESRTNMMWSRDTIPANSQITIYAIVY